MAINSLALWTLFVWGGRVRNLMAEPGGILDVNRWSLVTALGLSTLALVVLGLSLLGAASTDPTAAFLGSLTIVVWAVRGLDIALGDHPIGFIVVHLVLAMISVGLSGWVIAGSGRLPFKAWVNQ